MIAFGRSDRAITTLQVFYTGWGACIVGLLESLTSMGHGIELGTEKDRHAFGDPTFLKCGFRSRGISTRSVHANYVNLHVNGVKLYQSVSREGSHHRVSRETSVSRSPHSIQKIWLTCRS